MENTIKFYGFLVLSFCVGCDGSNLPEQSAEIDAGADTMTRPTEDPRWATDATFTSGVDSGQPTRVDVGGLRDQGFLPEEECSAAVLNNQLGVLGDWVQYSRDIDWLNFDPVSLAAYGCTGVGTTLWAGAVGGTGAVDNALIRQRYVALSDTSKILTSVDGRVWSTAYSDASYLASLFNTRSVFWSNVAQKFLVGSSNSSAGYELLSSPDGVTFTPRTVSGTDGVMAFAENDSIIVAGGNANSNAIHSSTDGVTWTARYVNAAYLVVNLAWNGSVFVALSSTGDRATSPDGITWTDRGNPNAVASALRRGLVWDGSVFVVSSGLSGLNGRETSVDGVTWTLVASVDLDNIAADICEMVADGPNIYGINYARDLFYRSADSGATWDLQRLSAGFGNGITIGGGRLITFGSINSLPGLLLGVRTSTR